jgi:hypothetical protein
MKQGIMALESLPEDGQDRLEGGDSDIDVIDALADQQEQTEALGYTGDLEEHLRAADAVEDLTDQLESTNGGVGLSGPACEALTLAVNHLVRKIGMESHHNTAAFEDYGTLKSRQKNHTTSLEAFGSVLKNIWAKIVGMIAKIWDWLKRTFSRANLSARIEEGRLKRQEERLKAERTFPHVKINTDEVFQNPGIHARLCRGKTVPQGAELIRSAIDHNELMRRLGKVFQTLDFDTMQCLENAFEAIHHTGDEFQKHIGEAFDWLLCSPIKGKVSSARVNNSYSDGVVLYEQPLIFGNAYFFRSAAESSAKVHSGDIVCTVTTSLENPVDVDHSQPMHKIDIDQCEELHGVIADGARTSDMIRKDRQRDADRLSRILSLAQGLERSSGNNEIERTAKRAQLLAKAIGWYTTQRMGIDVHLANYDKAIRSAMLAYINESIRSSEPV